MFNKKLLSGLDYLDQSAFFLGYDDHDLCLRAAEKGLRVGFFPVGFRSDPGWGSSRKKRTLASEFSLARERFRVEKNWRASASYAASLSGSYPVVKCEVVEIQGGDFAGTQ